MANSSAPGKLLIAGEYAVLEGAAAIAMAVDVRAHASVALVTGQGSRLIIPDDGLSFNFRSNKQGFHWQKDNEPGHRASVLEAVTTILTEQSLLPDTGLPPVDITLTTADFYTRNEKGDRIKLGLGSSAAIVVALCDALLRTIGATNVDQPRLLQLCCDAHRRFQRDAGSGIDVMTSLMGGIIARPEKSATDTPHEIKSLDWPKGLQVLVVWSGISASTPQLLTRFTDFANQNPQKYRDHIDQLRADAATLLAAWPAGNPADILKSLQAYGDGLLALDHEADIGIYSPEHQQLRQLAFDHGVVYKPSGAGGGDFGLLLMESTGIREKLIKAIAQAGFSCLTTSLGSPGLRTETD